MNYKEYTVQKKQKQKQKQKKKILKMIKTLYVNKRGRLILGEGQNKIIKKQKGGGLGALLIPLTKAALSAFGSGKREEMARRNRIIMVKQDAVRRVTLPNSRTFLHVKKNNQSTYAS